MKQRYLLLGAGVGALICGVNLWCAYHYDNGWFVLPASVGGYGLGQLAAHWWVER